MLTEHFLHISDIWLPLSHRQYNDEGSIRIRTGESQMGHIV